MHLNSLLIVNFLTFNIFRNSRAPPPFTLGRIQMGNVVVLNVLKREIIILIGEFPRGEILLSWQMMSVNVIFIVEKAQMWRVVFDAWLDATRIVIIWCQLRGRNVKTSLHVGFGWSSHHIESSLPFVSNQSGLVTIILETRRADSLRPSTGPFHSTLIRGKIAL